MKTILSILLFCCVAFSQTIIPDSNYVGKKWLLFGWYKTYTAPTDAYGAYMYFDSNWTYSDPYYRILSTPNLEFWPLLDSCNGYLNWLFSLGGQENKKIFLEGTYDTICWGHGFQTSLIDSIYQDSAILLSFNDTLSRDGTSQILKVRLLTSGRLMGTYFGISGNDTTRFDSIITGLAINKLLSCLNRAEYWTMDSLVTNPEWTTPNYPRHSNLYCKGKSCNLLLIGDSSSQAENMLNQLTSLLVTTIMKVSTERNSIPLRSIEISSFPNPSNGSVRINLYLPANVSAFLNIVDIRGRIVSKLWQGKGSTSIMWQFKNEYGHLVPPGLYICQLQTENLSSQTRIILLNR